MIKVRFSGDPRKDPLTGKVPLTRTYLRFERVYGFKNELPEHTLMTNLRWATVSGVRVLLVNFHRDVIYFSKETHYGVSARTLEEPMWEADISSTKEGRSYYGLAPSEDGQLLTCSFFSNQAILLELTLGQKEIIEKKVID